MVLGPLISVIFIVFGGYYVNESTVPLPLRWVPKASLIRQGFEALCINEFSGLEFDASKEGDVKTGEQALARLGFDKRGGADPVVSLARILLFNYWMTYRVLKARKPRFQPLEATKVRCWRVRPP